MIFTAGISIAFFISALLLVKKDKSRSDWILFCWTLINAAHLSFFYLLFTEKIYDYPFLLGLQFPLPLLHGVMLFLYVSSVTNFLPKRRYLTLLHFFPSLITFIYLIPFFLLPAEQKIEIFKNEGKGYEMFQFVVFMSVFLSGIIYVILSSRWLFKHKKRIRNQFSDIEEINLRWLQFLTYGLGLVWFLVIFTQNDFLIFTGVSIFIILIGFFGLQQKEIFKNKEKVLIADTPVTLSALSTGSSVIERQSSSEEIALLKEVRAQHLDESLPEPKQEPLSDASSKVSTTSDQQESDSRANEKEKYVSSGLSAEKAAQLHEKLNLAMTEEKLYKSNDLSLSQLADQLSTHPNYLSQILNEIEEMSFYDYVNTYRVNEFKRLIAIPKNQNLTLLAVAYDCGFNSKSSFNRYFKKCTDQTPSQFVKSIKS